VVLRGARERRLRLALTVSAVVLGVAFLSGTLVLTATVRQAMRDQAGTTTPGLSVAVLPHSGFGGRVELPSALEKQIAAIRGVSATQVEVQGPVEVVAPGQAAVAATGISVLHSSTLQGLELRSGHLPEGPGQVVVDDQTFAAKHWKLGERVRIGGQAGSAIPFVIVGVAKADAAQGLAGTPVAAFSVGTAQRLLGLTGRYSEIEVSAVRGVTPSVLAARISGAVGPHYQVLTASQLVNLAVNGDFRSFSLLSTILVVLGAIVLFVAAFLVVNTFSIVVAQRTRELALLRCLGASRSQLMGSVLAESFLVGLGAAIVGVVLGIIGAVVLLGALPGAGLDLPPVGPSIHPVAVLVPIALGVGATLAACVLPAVRSTSVAPMAALRDDPVGEADRSARPRATIGAVTLGAGVGLLLAGLFSEIGHEGEVVAAGAVLTFVGLSSLSPLASRPLARVLGWPLVAARGLPAAIAQQNAMRNPRRTASTAAALLVGVALVSFMAVITASARASATDNITDALRAGFVVQGDQQGSVPLGDGLVSHLRADRSLAEVVPVSFVRFEVDGGGGSGFVVNPSTYPTVVDLGDVQGDFAALGAHTVAVSAPVAATNGWHLGERVTVDFGSAPATELRITAIFPTGDTFGGLLFSSVDPPRGLTDLTTSRVFVEGRAGSSPSEVQSSISRATSAYPQAQIQNESSLESQEVSQVNQIVNLITVILILAVVIGLVGIVNTLALSVLERTREIGLLRALGMSRSQIRAMVRHESVIVALLGAVAGVVVGCLLAWAMQHSLQDQGLNVLQFPLTTLVAYLVVAGAAGVVAGILPARRAADLDILAALAAE